MKTSPCHNIPYFIDALGQAICPFCKRLSYQIEAYNFSLEEVENFFKENLEAKEAFQKWLFFRSK